MLINFCFIYKYKFIEISMTRRIGRKIINKPISMSANTAIK